MLGLILAAGAGSRMGGLAKALLTLPDGRTFLQAIVETGSHAGVESWRVVVAEPFAARVAVAAQDLGLESVHNPAPERGMASSVATAFAHALTGHSSDLALMWPVDVPNVASSTVRRLHSAIGGQSAVVPTFRGRGGHPLLVHRELWPDMAGCLGQPRGARSVLQRHAARVVRVEVDDAGVVVDVDRPGDLRYLGESRC